MPRVGVNDDLRAHKASLDAKRNLPGPGNRMGARRIAREWEELVDADGNIKDARAARERIATWREFGANTNEYSKPFFLAAADELEKALNATNPGIR